MTSSMLGRESKALVIQDRDRKLLSALATLRIVDREQAKIAGGFNSTTRVNVRLLTLHRAGLLRRFFLGANKAARKALYSLSRKGAAFVGVKLRGPRRPNDTLLVADFFVLHQLAVNDIYFALKRSSEILGISVNRWISFHESLQSGIQLIPDGYFELQASATTMTAFLEVDLGHEALRIWKKKIEGYLQLALSGEYERRFGQRQFRVLVVANSDRRLASIRKTIRASTQKIFRLATAESIRSSGLFAPVWFRPEGGKPQTLFS